MQKKTLIMMSVFLFFVNIISAQTSKKIDLNLKNGTLNELITTIENQTDYTFMYSNIKLDSPIEIEESQITVESALNKILTIRNISFEIVGKQIVLKELKLQKSTPRKIKGKVTDLIGEPLIGVSILVEGTTTGTVTDFDGRFELEVPAEHPNLRFTYVGHKEQIVAITNQNDLAITLEENSKSLDEVVVVGYGMVKKRDLTGSIASIKSDEFMKGRPTSINQSLQGRLAGVNVTKNDGAPGGGVSIKIRGANSFFSGTEPLYVIDGIPLTTGAGQETVKFNNDISQNNPLAFLDPNDIESVEVLKDGSSVAIYGSRGSNGVVMITTKSGSAGKDRVKINMQLSVNSLGKKIDVLGARDFAEYQNEAYRNLQIVNGVPVGNLPYRGNTAEDAERILGGMAPSEYQNVDYYWQNALYRTALTRNIGMEYSGVTNKLDYIVSGSYLNQEGIIMNSDYKRYNFKVNINNQVMDWLKLGSSTNFSTSLTNRQKTSTSGGDLGVVNSALYYFPTYTKESAPDGSKFQMIANPDAYTRILNQNKNYSFYTSNYLNATIIRGLVFRSVLAYNLSLNTGNQYLPRTIPEGASYPGLASIGNNTWQSVTWDNLLMYNKTFDKHDVNATIGTSWGETNVYNVSTYNSGFGSDSNNGWDIGDGTKLVKPSSYKSRSAMLSYIFRAAYTYDRKYNLTMTMREDASSVFPKNNRFAFFPSVGLGWTVTNEKFMQESSSVLNNLKIRYSYGESGNAGIGAYGSLPKFSSANAPLGGGTSSGYGPDFYNPGNPNLKWETTKQHDLGLDFSILNRVNVTVDFYNKLTTDILQNLPQPSSKGVVHVLSNIGDVSNKGFEFSVRGDIISNKDFMWNVSANIALNRNIITKLNNNENDKIVPMEPFVLEKGRPIGQLFGYVEEGIWNSREEIINGKQFQKMYPGYTTGSNDPATEIQIRKSWLGEIRYADLDWDDKISTMDRTYIGDVNPDFNYGFGMNFAYKKLDFSFLFDGVKGGKILNMRLLKFMNMGGYNNTLKTAVENAWTPEKGGTNPKIAYINTRPTYYSSRYLEDGSYLKLRNISVGYTLNNVVKHVSAIRFYAHANNLLTFTKYTGYDPEINSYGSNPIYRGVDLGGFPQSREFSFGINLTF